MKDRTKQADNLRVEAVAAELEEAYQQSLTEDWVEQAEFWIAQAEIAGVRRATPRGNNDGGQSNGC